MVESRGLVKQERVNMKLGDDRSTQNCTLYLGWCCVNSLSRANCNCFTSNEAIAQTNDERRTSELLSMLRMNEEQN